MVIELVLILWMYYVTESDDELEYRLLASILIGAILLFGWLR